MGEPFISAERLEQIHAERPHLIEQDDEFQRLALALSRARNERDALARRVAELEAALDELRVSAEAIRDSTSFWPRGAAVQMLERISALASSGGTGAAPPWCPTPEQQVSIDAARSDYEREAGLREIVERAVDAGWQARCMWQNRSEYEDRDYAQIIADEADRVLAGERATRDERGGGATVAGASRGRAAAASGTPLNDPGNPPLGASPNTSTGCGERSSSPSPSREQAGRADSSASDVDDWHYQRECPACGHVAIAYLHCRHDRIPSRCVRCGEALPSGSPGECTCEFVVPSEALERALGTRHTAMRAAAAVRAIAAIRREAVEDWIADSVVPGPAAHLGEILAQAGLRAVHADNEEDRITNRNWDSYRNALAATAHNLIAAAVKVGREQGREAIETNEAERRVIEAAVNFSKHLRSFGMTLTPSELVPSVNALHEAVRALAGDAPAERV